MLAPIQMMKEISIRPATSADLATLLEFEQGIIAAERPFDTTLKEGEIHYYDIAQMIAAPDVHVLVAVAGNEIAGSGYARIEAAKPYLRYRKYAYLGFMFVKPEYRGMGVNKLIMEALGAWCAERDINEMRLEVYSENLPAVKAYEKAGFEPILTWMRKETSKI